MLSSLIFLTIWILVVIGIFKVFRLSLSLFFWLVFLGIIFSIIA